jgi:hypothetical protein
MIEIIHGLLMAFRENPQTPFYTSVYKVGMTRSCLITSSPSHPPFSLALEAPSQMLSPLSGFCVAIPSVWNALASLFWKYPEIFLDLAGCLLQASS